MSVLIDSGITIYDALQNIKNGKYVMPAFQRQYVWSMEQIEKLRGCEVHSTVILSAVDERIFKRLGVNLTCEPKFQ